MSVCSDPAGRYCVVLLCRVVCCCAVYVSVCSDPAARCKIFVGNLHKDTQLEELRGLFQRHGNVVEADIISNYAFVVSPGS